MVQKGSEAQSHTMSNRTDRHYSHRYRNDWPPVPPWAADWVRPRASGVPLRASSAERAAVTDALLHHYADGRLDEEEYDRRMRLAAGATTIDDLDDLLVDLPADGPAHTVATPGRPGHPGRLGRRHRHHPGTARLVLLVLLAWLVASTAIHLAAATARLLLPWALVAVVVMVVMSVRHRR